MWTRQAGANTFAYLLILHSTLLIVKVQIRDSNWASMGFPGGTVVKNLPDNAGDAGSIPGSGRSLGGGNGNSLQYYCLENSMDRGAWWTTVLGVAKSQARLRRAPAERLLWPGRASPSASQLLAFSPGQEQAAGARLSVYGRFPVRILE